MTKDVLHQFLERYTTLKEDQSLRPGKDILTNEFQKIKRESEKLLIEGQTVATHGAKEINRKKNRYKDILPFDHSRVILHKQGNYNGTDYINANYIMSPGGKKGYIASQGPMPSTVNDFWRMILQHKVKVVVMACKEIELGKHRCQRYWPLEGEQLNFDGIGVKLVKEKSITSSLCERTLHAVEGKERLELVQFHYTAWPDHGVPKTTSDLIHMIELVRERHPWDDPPVLMHCSAGCGRTGVMVAVDYGRRLLRRSPEAFDVYDLVMTLRKQRPAMVQSKEQYEYLHDVFKDLIEEHLNKSARQLSPSSCYMNVEFGAATMDAPLYENIDVFHVASSKPRQQKSSPANDDTNAIAKVERPIEAKKPVITNAVPSPQRAFINNEPLVNKPKPMPKPVKVINLMDNDPNFPSDSQLQSPLLPTPSPPPPSQTVEMRKPNSDIIYLAERDNGSEQVEKRKLKLDKDYSQHRYVNFGIGSAKVPYDPKFSAEKPLSPKKRPEVDVAKPKIGNKPSQSKQSAEDIFKQSSSPKLPMKQKPNIENSSNVVDAVDGARPPLPLKLKDLSEFDSIFSPESKDVFSGKENLTSSAPNNVNSVVNKSRTFGQENSDDRKPRKDLWSKYSPDYEVASFSLGNRIPMVDYTVVDISTSKQGMKATKEDVKGSYSSQETSKAKGPDQRPKADLMTGRKNGNEKKTLSTDTIFTPFEPSSSVRVSPTPKVPIQDGLVSLRNPSFGTKESIDIISQESTGKKASSDALNVQRRDGLVRRTNNSIIRAEGKTDAHAAKTNYVVSVQKANVQADVTPQKVPQLHKQHSEPQILDKEPKEAMRPRRVLSEDAKSYFNEEVEDDTDSVDAGSQYAVVSKNCRKVEEESSYEVIWTGPKSTPNTSKSMKPQILSGKPPSLPPRTPESYIFADKDECQTNEKQVYAQVDPSPNENSGEQSSFQWLSVGVDKLKKLTNIKGALSAGMKQNLRSSSQPEVNSSAFYTPTPAAKDSNANSGKDGRSSHLPGTKERGFPHRLQQKPRGPRPLPNYWTPL